jgi:hypothetical protein
MKHANITKHPLGSASVTSVDTKDHLWNHSLSKSDDFEAVLSYAPLKPRTLKAQIPEFILGMIVAVVLVGGAMEFKNPVAGPSYKIKCPFLIDSANSELPVLAQHCVWVSKFDNS